MAKKRSSWGSITQAKANVWRLRYPLPADPATGKRKQGSETVYGKRADATKRLAELRLLYDETKAHKGALTVSKCWELYYRPSISKLAPSTIAGYESKYNNHIKPAFGQIEMTSIKKHQVQTWLDAMTYGQARACHAVLRAMYSFANDNDLIDSSLMSKRYTLPKKPKTTQELKVHNDTTLLQMLAELKGEPWESAFILSAFGGARREEAFGAKWENVELYNDHVTIKLCESVQYVNGQVLIGDLKTDSSYRDIVILGKPAERLSELYFENLGDTWLCEDIDGTPVNPDTMATAYKRWHISKSYTYIPWRNLRNSYATNLHAKGVELGLIAKLLGHTTPTITYKHYDRISTEQILSALKK